MLFWVIALQLFSSGLHAHHPGCSVKQGQDLTWPWLEGEVGLWIEGGLKESVFEIHLTSGGSTQTLIVTRSHVRWSLESEDDQVAFPEVLVEGWNKFALKVSDGDLNLCLLSWSTSKLLLDLALAKTIEQVKVIGSNVTIDCISDEYSWRIPEEGAVAVPFGPKGGPYYLHFFSQKGVRPVLHFSNETSYFQLQLGWDGERITVDGSAMPLPPAIYHAVIMSCKNLNADITCFMKQQQHGTNESEETIYQFSLAFWPKSFFVQSLDKTPFLLTLSSSFDLDEGPGVAEKGSRMRTRVVFIDSSPSSTGAIIALTIAVTVIVLVLLVRLRKVWKRRRPQLIKLSVEEGITLMDAPPPSQSYAQFQAAVASKQQNACMVAGYEQAEPSRRSFRLLFNRNSKRLKDITMEVHKRGDKQCLVVINNHFDQDDVASTSNMISKVLKQYEEATLEIFKAALAGQYEGVGGVKGLLVNNSLPGTIQDQYGRSLLHYAAFAKGPSRDPLWTPEYVKDLVGQHNCYTRAVDFAGQSPLHTLARSSCNSQAWLKLAEIFMDLDCNPQQKDYQGKTPSDRITDNPELALLFAKETESPTEDLSKKDLAIACEEGDTETVIHQLRNLPPLRLSLAPPDLLSRAIKGGHRDLMFLLLSAGEPVLGGCVGSTTALEFAHTADDTPAIFPAVLRKVFCDTLAGEINKITGNDLSSKTLRIALQDIKKCVHREGFDIMMLRKLPKDRDLLCETAKLGLSVTCQLLAMGGIRIVALRYEHQLFKSAIKEASGLREDTLYTIVRDLRTCPYSIDEIKSEIPADFHTNLWERDIKLLSIDAEDRRTNLATEVDAILKASDEGIIILSESLKESIVQHNLYAVLDRLKTDAKIDFKQTKYQTLGKSLLATAVDHNNVSVAEYLLFQGVESSDIKKYIHKDDAEEEEGNSCLKYIMKFSRERKETNNENNLSSWDA